MKRISIQPRDARNDSTRKYYDNDNNDNNSNNNKMSDQNNNVNGVDEFTGYASSKSKKGYASGFGPNKFELNNKKVKN